MCATKWGSDEWAIDWSAGAHHNINFPRSPALWWIITITIARRPNHYWCLRLARIRCAFISVRAGHFHSFRLAVIPVAGLVLVDQMRLAYVRNNKITLPAAKSKWACRWCVLCAVRTTQINYWNETDARRIFVDPILSETTNLREPVECRGELEITKKKLLRFSKRTLLPLQLLIWLTERLTS